MKKHISWFLDPIRNHYFDFEGRVTRQTYWMFTLWVVVIQIVLNLTVPTLALIFALAVLLPSIALGARRLHDTGKSGWWQLLVLIPFIGFIIVIVLLALRGKDGENEYGKDPRQVATLPLSPDNQVLSSAN